MSGQVKELKSKKIAQLVVEALEDLKGESIRSIDVQKLTEITDYMVIVTGRSSTHIKALSDSVAKKVKEAGLDILGMEASCSLSGFLLMSEGWLCTSCWGQSGRYTTWRICGALMRLKGRRGRALLWSLLQTHENAITVSRHQDGGLGGRGHRALQQAHRAGDEFLSC